MKRAVVLGVGISGTGAAAWLLIQGYEVLALDKRAHALKELSQIKALIDQGLKLLSDDEEIDFSSLSFLILSPGIPQEHPVVQKALAESIEVIGEVEFAIRQLKNRCIGITGSNGKTTTTLLTTHILQEARLPAKALGNVGRSLSSYLPEIKNEDILILELSSFQLETLSTPCLMGALILNITPNHLDRYASFQEYATAKYRIKNLLLEEGRFFLPGALQKETGWGESFETEPDLSQNEQAAKKLSELFGVTPKQFHLGIKTFQRPPHRIEWVAEKNGCVYYNDSKATNVDSVMYGVRSLKGPLILLVGGKDKRAPYSPWIEGFRGKVKMLIAFGEAAFKIEAELAPFFPFVRVLTMEEAIKCAALYAKPGDSVALCPGCSSYDQFISYEHRGDEFKRLVREVI